MANKLVGLNAESALEEKERLLADLPSLSSAELGPFVQELKKETDRLIQVNIARCRALAALIVEIGELTGNLAYRATGLLADANACAIGLGQYAQAIEIYNEAAELFSRCDQPVERAKVLIGRLYALGNLGGYEKALADGEWARGVLRAHAEWYHLARLKVNLAIIYGRMGEDKQALALLDLARQAYAQSGAQNELSVLRVEMNRAHVLRNLGRFQESIETSQRLYESHCRLNRGLDAARAQQTLALTYFVQGRYNEALVLLDQVREVFLRDGRQRHAMLVELFISDCLLQLRRFNDVLEKCRQVRTLFTELGTRFEVGQAILNEAAAEIGLRDYAAARASLAEARALFEQEGNQVAVAETDLQTALVLLDSDQANAALVLAGAAMQAFEQHNLPLWQARAGLAAARAHLAGQQDLGAARAVIQQALEIGQTHQLPGITFAAHHLRGQIALLEGQTQAGLADYKQAIQDLEQLCGRMMVEFRAGFIEDKARIYEDIVALYLTMEQPEQGLTYAERAKSRALLDMIAYRLDLSITPRSEEDRPLVDELVQLRGERDRLYRRWKGGEGFGVRGETAQLLEEDRETSGNIQAIEKHITGLWHTLLIRNADYAREAGLWQIQTEPVRPYLEPGTLLLEYFSVHGELVAFVANHDTVQAIRLSDALPTVQNLLQFVWLNLRSVQANLRAGSGVASAQSGARLANIRSLLQRIYGLLIAPLDGLLAGAHKLVIVPHGPLHYLPFHALFDGLSYLLERFEISYLPGSSLLRYAHEGPRSAENGAFGNFRGRGAPACAPWVDPGRTRRCAPTTEIPRDPENGVLVLGNSFNGRLPYAVEEARAVAELWGGTALVEEAASLDALRQSAGSCRLLHLAAHGEFRSDNPLFSGLALAGGWLTTLEVFNLRLNAELVALSACQTGRSVVGGGDELFGLMRAFLAAGAASLVATFWTVEDRSTARLMQRFYERLVQGESRGAALRQAQLQFLRDDQNEGYSHPYFWAPFFLVGNPGTRRDSVVKS
jgi:CHAT domain-containing protein/tetratricopeptide (TPR) repeat protein